MINFEDWLTEHLYRDLYVDVRTDNGNMLIRTKLEDFSYYGKKIELSFPNDDNLVLALAGAEISYERGSGTEEFLTLKYPHCCYKLMTGSEWDD